MTETYTIEYNSRRCAVCGSFWAFESSRDSNAYQCPACNRKVLREQMDTMDGMIRTERALRGVITKLKKGKMV